MALGGYPLPLFMFLDTQVAYRAVSVSSIQRCFISVAIAGRRWLARIQCTSIVVLERFEVQN
jgi:hypothetical protein